MKTQTNPINQTIADDILNKLESIAAQEVWFNSLLVEQQKDYKKMEILEKTLHDIIKIAEQARDQIKLIQEPQPKGESN